MHFFLALFQLLALSLALPLSPRLYQPTSPQFSLIAHHKGAVFQYHLVKYDSNGDLVLNTDETAFFGRIKASSGYVLNVPGATNGSSIQPSNVNVEVDAKSHRLTTATKPIDASSGFGIVQSKLSYENVTDFKACPENNYRGEYALYWNADCPLNATGYDVQLLVQVDATINYNEDTNN